MSTYRQRRAARDEESPRPEGRWVDVRCFHCGKLLARVASMVEAKRIRIKCSRCHVTYPERNPRR